MCEKHSVELRFE